MTDISKIIAGSDVWIVERDEECEAVDVTCYMFLAKAEDYIICSAFVHGHDYSANTILEYHANETRESSECGSIYGQSQIKEFRHSKFCGDCGAKMDGKEVQE